MHLIAVVLNCPTETARLEDSEVLLNYGFRQFELATPPKGRNPGYSPCSKNSRTVNLVSNERITAVIPRGEVKPGEDNQHRQEPGSTRK